MTHFNVVVFAALTIFTAGFLPSQGHAQVVLESGGAATDQSSEVEFQGDEGQALRVQEVLTTSRFIGYKIAAFGSTSRDLCMTPCRLLLDRPMTLRIGGVPLNASPDGSPQRFVVRPMRFLLRAMSVLTIALAGSAILGGGLVLSLIDPEFAEENDQDVGTWRLASGIAIGAGVALLIAGIIGMVRSRARIVRVDRFEF